MAQGIFVQGMEHGWIGHATGAESAVDRIPRRRRFVLSEWLPAALQARGMRVDRETERAYADLSAARDARESGR
ncbi:hypothetical protein [Leifsonia sp. Le1]|uniref:hypothetical protein n=1 Tax=Leifsonia sp. Le1 TaxID=3404918 RepID=UPI003EB7FCBE